MHRGPQQDPGEDPPPQGSSLEQRSESPDLKDQLEHQQVVIAQFKEMLQKTDQSSSMQEKVDRYASTLSKMTMRAKKSKLKKESSGGSSEKSTTKSGMETPVNEKISLLRRQLEENKAKLAERGKSQKDIEEMVLQLKAQFDDSFQLIHDTSSNFSILEPKTEYNKSSSSEELYNILVNKEKRITDLHSKVQKLETMILDLQENLKEKDCVIDARTKAITLMSESLSKKSKNTQDALDETKEHMRKMQEDFVKLENEMKARQMKLLDDLRLKNLEIAELQEINENLQKSGGTDISDDNTNNLKKNMEDLLHKIDYLEATNSNLEKQNKEFSKVIDEAEGFKSQLEESRESSKIDLEAKQNKISELEEIIEGLKSDILKKPNLDEDKKQDNEVEKLRKELDDLNKNMIKVKVEHKKKIKNLNKKIDSFKKIGDLNAHIVKLSEENDGLNERIAELEEEKGNYQLKMIDEVSPRESEISSEEMEVKVKELSEKLLEKSSKIESLISENASLKQEIESLNERLLEYSGIQNEKVTSEMSSIQYEEKLHKEMEEMKATKEKLETENVELTNRVETLMKEKSELQSKLEQYIQENMELIDKLEKMSAEKVSSAESIEIVENLTMQEKLELEEYQKNLDPQSGKLKMSEEHLEENPDLNDSVNRLTEETSELLQKIELFTIERREVMEKMDSLTTENSHLTLKLKQVENNSELLTETYEQLQSEKEKLDEKIDSLEKENELLKQKIDTLNKDYNVSEFNNLKEKLFDLEGEYIKLGDDNENLHKELKRQSELIHEKNRLEIELKEANNKISEFETQLSDNLEEIRTYQSVIEENKEEFIKSAVQINELKEIIAKKESEIEGFKSEVENLNKTINNFNEKINELENQCHSGKEKETTIENMEKQLHTLKKALDENIGQITDYENELEENSNLIKNLNQQMKELSNKNLELQNILHNRNEEQEKTIEKLQGEIQELQSQIRSKDEMFHQVSSEMKNKFISLHKQTDSNTESLEDMREPLQKRIEELTNKNNALVEKMKKLAANLKKKTQNCQELEKQLKLSEEKWETELKEKDSWINEAKEEIKELKSKIEMYQTEINNLKHAMEQKIEKDNIQCQSHPVKSEMSLHDELLGSNFVQETFAQQDDDNKIKELELIVETQQNDLSSYKDRISALEEMLSKMDEKKKTLEQKTNELGVQLAEKSQSFEEISKTEDLLEEKITKLSKYNEELEKKLGEISANNQKLTNENNKLRESAKKLKQKLIVAQERVNELLLVKENSLQIEEELNKSRNHIITLEQDIRKLEHEKVELQDSAKTDIEKLDNDWQIQFDSVMKEKSELSIFCEKLNERITELTETEQILSDKVKELESKLEKSFELQESSDFELSSQRNEIQALKDELDRKNEEIDNHIVEIRHLQTSKQIELNFVNEIKKENELLKEKENELLQQLNAIKCELEETKKDADELRSVSEKQRLDATEPSNKEETQSVNPLFSWTSHEDPFSFVEQQTASILQQPSDSLGTVQDKPKEEKQLVIDNPPNTEAELQQKIETLEFMLKNVENERDEIMHQCTHLSNELMNMVYLGQNPAASQNLEPVNEPLFEKKTAYLCYPEDSVEEKEEVLHSIETQVVSQETSEPSLNELQNIEFTRTRDLTDSTNPFLEDPIQRKEAYLCHPDDTKASAVQVESSKPLGSSPDEINIDTFGENDDGWGWSPEEAKLEELQNQEFESNPLRMKIIELEDKIKAMDAESQNKQREFQELQVKSGKLIKKLKELKVQNETLKKGKKEDDSDMFNLESAIQEELKSQIEILEKRIGEMVNELTKEKNEKQTLQKKLETLSSTNQRMIEMREKQDIEMLMWQRKTEELKSKLDQLEWGESEGTPEKSKRSMNSDKVNETDILKLQNTIAEMNETIKELTLDNEELQALLEEQRTLRITAEKAKSVEPIPDNMKTESEYLEMVHQKQTLEVELNKVMAEKENLNEELNRISSHMKTEEEFKEILNQKHDIEEQLKRISSENEILQSELNQLITSMKSEEEYMEVINQKQILEKELKEVTIEKMKLQEDFNNIIERNKEQNVELENLLGEKSQMEKLIAEKNSIVEQLMLNSEESKDKTNKLNELEKEKTESELRIQELTEKINNLETNQHGVMSQIDAHISNQKTLVEEINDKNDIIESLRKEKENLLHELDFKDREIENMKLKIENESSSLKSEVSNQIQNMEHLIQENQELTSRQKQLEQQIESLSKQIEMKESEYQIQLEKLNQEWQILVDQRGSDVAESWKLHLDMRETEFGEIEQRLKKEINDLEEKCNSLVNENNELRKNVDTEIRNEVDRISALQQQINDRQQYINELSQTLKEKQLNVENLEERILQLQNDARSLQAVIEEKNVKINELNIIIETTQKQFNEKRIIVEDIVSILEEKSSSPILFDLESIKTELRKQLDGAISPGELSSLQKDLIEKDSMISSIKKELSAKEEEIAKYEETINRYSREIEKLKEHIANSNSEDQLRYLNDELKDKEVHLLNIQTALSTKTKELEESQLFIERYKSALEENEKGIKELSDRLAEKEGIISNLNYQLEETRNLRASDDENTQNLQYSLQQCRMQCDQLRLTLDEKCSLIDVMNAELEKQHSIHVERETTMEKLKSYVEELHNTHTSEKDLIEKSKNEIIAAQDQELGNLRNQLSQSQISYDELKKEKEMSQESVDYLQSQIEEQSKNIVELSSQIESYKKLNNELSHNLNELEELQKKYEEQNILLNEEEKQIDELRAIIENQVVKIEDLKQKLYEKSNDYDSLIAELDIRKSDFTVAAEGTRPPMGQGKLIGPSSSDDLNEWVTRSELDIALYMLHQRDVRCEELTVELTQLLEERDTLQLRLSNALREKEEYKRVMSDGGKETDIISGDIKSSPSKGAIPKGKVSDIVLSASGAEVAMEAQESSVNISENQLENKLSELKNIGYRRDKTLLDEQQQRRLQQLSFMQQHMDEASKLPPEAAARLVDANYTLSRDVQSPSKVLLNWLWGRSTPKVNDL
ncbi:golgin subfamily B member 1-like [Coccinella septempunctata]|uniref:golgin subfamily B member 1-like n=1 Tax=Coccinella septempunctata TaxID=41139 RepID=UPI001D05D25F|nr:golgin subfamily B member 1-like [Coccinella septempunctata]